ncbi:PREDICTED: uncharacterized protein LOC102019709 isoform X2 [Chinchilla lanigera]|uniref:uncharacterized protein LOC102019709 isoform X2 n=1 Tax=Chinchilla lanigera TaxID=34839 RepID=UPI00069713FA|nr:PREDICTED: uncharacterized protein LOC102019709 isoform X2 [Chinchilla lanigera]
MTPLFAKPNIYLFFQSAQRTIANRPGPPQDTQRIEGTSGPAGEALENAKVLKQEIRRGRESIIRRPNASRGLRAAPRSAASRDSHGNEASIFPSARARQRTMGRLHHLPGFPRKEAGRESRPPPPGPGRGSPARPGPPCPCRKLESMAPSPAGHGGAAVTAQDWAAGQMGSLGDRSRFGKGCGSARPCLVLFLFCFFSVPESNSRPCAGQAGSVPMSKIPSPARPCLARGGPGFIPSATKEDKRK